MITNFFFCALSLDSCTVLWVKAVWVIAIHVCTGVQYAFSCRFQSYNGNIYLIHAPFVLESIETQFFEQKKEAYYRENVFVS